jgi:hypothetical protein
MELLAHEAVGLRRPILCKKNEEMDRLADDEGDYTPVFHGSAPKTAPSSRKARKRRLQDLQHVSTGAKANKNAAENCPKNRPSADP